MPNYEVISPLEHDGKKFKPGTNIEMPAEKAKELLCDGVLKLKPERPVKQAEDKKK